MIGDRSYSTPFITMQHSSLVPSREEALDAAKRLRMQRKAFLRKHSSTEAYAWLDEWKKEHDSSD